MFQCDIDGCGAMFYQNAGWIQYCHRVHEGVERAALLRSRINKSNQQLQAALKKKAENGFCCVSVACPDKATINGGRVIPACERHRKTWLQRTALRLRIPASRRPRHGWGIHISNPDEMTACLFMVPVPSAIVSLVRKIEQVNIPGGDFYIDFEFVSLGRFREDESPIQRFPVEIAVRRLDGQFIIDTPIKYDKLIPELLAGIPRTGSTANFSWAVMKKVYGQEEETFGKRWDEVRHLLHDAGMNKDSYVVEWPNSGIDYSFLKMIMQQHTPSNSILLIHFWRTVLPGFSSMKLSYFYAFLYPDSTIHEHAHQASFDSLMLVKAMRALIDLAHRDDPRAEEFGTGELRNDEQISRLLEQLEIEYDKDEESDDGQSGKDVDSLKTQIAHEEAIKVMTDEEKELADLYLKSYGILPSVDSISGPTNSSSLGKRGS